MITARTSRMLRELQCEPLTSWFCALFGILEPREMAGRADTPVDVEDLRCGGAPAR